MRKLRKLIPKNFQGQLELKDVTFYYPANEPVDSKAPGAPDLLTHAAGDPNLNRVSMFFPSGEFTFIIGESGSGKSTIGAVLMGLYPILKGSIEVDQLGSINWLDSEWYRNQISLVSGLTSNFLLPGTLHENIAIGVGSTRDWRKVSREEVIRAAKFALLHEFITDLPEGYDTRLDSSQNDQALTTEVESEAASPRGVQNLSGGQKQRLGLARAWLRDAPVLILDEATSALDLTAQALMYDALRHWRRNKTTICITHDLTPIGSEDFVYLMRQGRIMESDYRFQLEALSRSAFNRMANRSENHKITHSKGTVNVKEENQYSRIPQQTQQTACPRASIPSEKLTNQAQIRFSEPLEDIRTSGVMHLTPKPKRLTFLEGFIRAMQSENGFLAPQQSGLAPGIPTPQNNWRRSISHYLPSGEEFHRHDSSASVLELLNDDVQRQSPTHKFHSARYSTNKINLNVVQKTEKKIPKLVNGSAPDEDDDEYQEFTASVILQASKIAANRRNQLNNLIHSKSQAFPDSVSQGRKNWLLVDPERNNGVNDKPRGFHFSGGSNKHHKINMPGGVVPTWSIGQLIRNLKPTINCKSLMLLGCLISIASGAMTPLFSIVLGSLLGKLAAPPPGFILQSSIYIVIISLGDGFLSYLRVFIMEKASMAWLESLRGVAFEKIVLQDHEWFDLVENSPSNLIARVIKDGNDCKDLIGQLLADLITIFTLITIAFVWALIIGWQLTLVGLSLVPIFFLIIGGGERLNSRFEQLNKNLREEVASQFHQSISNVKAIRALSLESLLREKFLDATVKSRKMFVRSAPLGGISYGLNIAMTYLAEGLMLYVGAVLVIKDIYTFDKLSRVFSLIIFSVTFCGQMISSVPSYSKSVRAAMDLLRIVCLPIGAKETRGDLRVPLKGQIEFRQVDFIYPSRPDFPVLKGVSFVINPGECVGIVGKSGSGKSTIAALLHRLYEPNSGSIRLDGFNITQIDSRHVRDQIGMVTQHPVLFNATVFENVSYGYMPLIITKNTTENMKKHLLRSEINRVIEQVHLSNFVDFLPRQLDSKIGENSDLVSSGQAQRISIARTILNRNRKILVFDECTSALDPINQREILATISDVIQSKTAVIITHKEAVMKMCDRLIVMNEGRIVEQGTYQTLCQKQNGFLSTLIKGGEYTQ